eukprot:gene11146-18766_t
MSAAVGSVFHHVVAKWIGELLVPDAARAGGLNFSHNLLVWLWSKGSSRGLNSSHDLLVWLWSKGSSRERGLNSSHDLLVWLWSKGSSPEREFRRKCLSLHMRISASHACLGGEVLAAAGPGASTVWLQQYCLEEGVSLAAAVAVHISPLAAVAVHISSPAPATVTNAAKNMASWCSGNASEAGALSRQMWPRQLSACLQWATWAIKQHLLTANHLRAPQALGFGPSVGSRRSSLLSATINLLVKICKEPESHPSHELLRLLASKTQTCVALWMDPSTIESATMQPMDLASGAADADDIACVVQTHSLSSSATFHPGGPPPPAAQGHTPSGVPAQGHLALGGLAKGGPPLPAAQGHTPSGVPAQGRLAQGGLAKGGSPLPAAQGHTPSGVPAQAQGGLAPGGFAQGHSTFGGLSSSGALVQGLTALLSAPLPGYWAYCTPKVSPPVLGLLLKSTLFAGYPYKTAFHIIPSLM